MKLLPQGRKAWRNLALRVLALLLLLVGGVLGAGLLATRGPGPVHEGPLPALTAQQAAASARLKADVEHLATTIGRRDLLEHHAALQSAEAWLVQRFQALGGYTVERQPFAVDGIPVANVVATRPGTDPSRVVVFGAHYDSVPMTPGADDNASGTAVLLELARRAAALDPTPTLVLVAFVNEEPPWFKSEHMGSLVFAKAQAAKGRAVEAMLSLEMLGTYSDAPGSQGYPPGVSAFYPDVGDFVAFVGDWNARPLVHRAVKRFRETTPFPSQVITAPAWVQGVDFSDHWSFWQAGFPQAIMVTDTAFNRTPHYHQPTDTPDRLDYDRMARVTDGLWQVLLELTGG